MDCLICDSATRPFLRKHFGAFGLDHADYRCCCSFSNGEAQLWLWFKDDSDAIERQVDLANGRQGGRRYEHRRRFVDYWKASPLRRLHDAR